MKTVKRRRSYRRRGSVSKSQGEQQTSEAPKTKRDTYLSKTYNISEAEYLNLLAVHGGNCWLCLRPPKPGKNLAVDHNHKLAKESGSVRVSVRGVLCFVCNKKVIGRRRKEHAWLLRRAADYLESDKAQEVLG